MTWLDARPMKEACSEGAMTGQDRGLCLASSRLTEMQDAQAALKILRFFCENRYTMDTADSIAIWVGFPRESAAYALNALVEAHFLERIGEGNDAVYVAAGGLAAGQLPESGEIESLLKEHP